MSDNPEVKNFVIWIKWIVFYGDLSSFSIKIFI